MLLSGEPLEWEADLVEQHFVHAVADCFYNDKIHIQVVTAQPTSGRRLEIDLNYLRRIHGAIQCDCLDVHRVVSPVPPSVDVISILSAAVTVINSDVEVVVITPQIVPASLKGEFQLV